MRGMPLAVGVLLVAAVASAAAIKNGFRLENALVPEDQILEGGPSRDGIPAVDSPEFVEPDAATWVVPPNPVLGVFANGVAKAYPVHLMEYHQVVNDDFAGEAVVVTYDPLTGVPRAFRRDVADEQLDFGVSGLIYNTGFLMYDRQTSSLWSQFLGKALAGKLVKRELSFLRIRQESWGAWLARHPDSRVLARPLPHKIDYRYSPFSAYWMSPDVPFPPRAKDDRFHPKEVVLGVEVEGEARAYLGSIVTQAGGKVSDEFRGRKLEIRYESELALFVWSAPDDVRVTDGAYWFAWKAFHPDTSIWKPDGATQ